MEKGVTEITDIVFSQKKEEEKEEEEEEEESVGAKQIGEEDKNSGGISIINTLISNLVAPKLRSGDEREEGTAAGDDEREAAAAGDGGGGFLDNLVSHLPTPLADDAAPASDEASILIHSLVHD